MKNKTQHQFVLRAAAALAMLSFASGAMAQFVDERSAAKPSAAPAAAVQAVPSATVTPVVAAPVPAAPVFEVVATDKTVRETLARWSKAAGWVHQPSHWTLDKDHPIAATAGADVFGPDFKVAARRLLSSTELTDRPAQPCFYVNRVVRVIPKAELCGKTQ